MNRQQFQEELKKSLTDQRLSRSEQQALRKATAGAQPNDLDWMRSVAFAVARGELPDDKHIRNVMRWLEEVMKVLRENSDDGPLSGAFFSPGTEPLRKIIGLMSAVKTSLDICVFTITDDRILEAILECHRRKVRVRVISDDDKAFDLGSDVNTLRTRGIDLRVDRSPHHMHHKFALFDGVELLTGSYNWTRSAEANNHENLITTGDPRLVAAFRNAFESLWNELA